MNTSRSLFIAIPAACLISISAVTAAPVASVDSSRANTDLQKIESFLDQEIVGQQLASLGLSREQVSQRLAQLDDAQLHQMASQVDLVQAGGTIQGAGVLETNPLRCILAPMGRFFYNVYQLFFCWGDLK